MQPLPVLAVIREAYVFTFTHLGAIIGLIWLPMVIVTVGDFFVTQAYSQQAQQALAAGGAAAAGPAVLIQFGFLRVRLALYGMMYVPVAQLALGQRQGGAMVHFAFGLPEWRMFRALLGLMLLAFLAGGSLISLLAGLALSPGGAAQRPAGAAGGSRHAAVLLRRDLCRRAHGLSGWPPMAWCAEEGPALARALILPRPGNFWRLLGRAAAGA